MAKPDTRTWLRIPIGIIIAAVAVLAVGYLEIQRIGANDGAVFDSNNVVTAIAEPELPLVEFIGLAACGAIILLFILWDIRGSFRKGAGFGTAGLVLTLVAVIIYVYATTDYVELLRQPPLPGVEGWLVKAAYHPVIHTAVLFGLVAPLASRLFSTRGQSTNRRK